MASQHLPKARSDKKASGKRLHDDAFIHVRLTRGHVAGCILALLLAFLVLYAQRRSIFHSRFFHSTAQHSTQDSSFDQQRLSSLLAGHKGAANIHQVFLEHEESHPDPHIRNLPADLSEWPYGEMGVGVVLNVKGMSGSEVAKRDTMYKNHAFEEYVSELISVDRSLPDWRDPWCKDTYDLQHQQAPLPDASIIICFYNEAWSTLIRSVHSVLNRTPKQLLREIILVDDASNMDHLGQRLDDYFSQNRFEGKVKILRQETRQGLMRSRLAGIRVSQAPILIFLDSHIEAGVGWIEPLLVRVHEDPKLIISPVIDAINDTTLFYQFIRKDLYGLMNWRMEFEWYDLSEQEASKKPHLWAPYANPIMAGGLFAIRRDWFHTLGLYDEGMEVWGGENLELSFKAWMCGGRIEIAPCSRVGHIFRSWSPYNVQSKQVNLNTIRVAQVWMDDFKYLFYDRLGMYDLPLEQRLGDFGDVTERVELRKKLSCKPFKWFMDNVARGLPYHGLLAAGELKNPASGLCIDKNDRVEFMGHPVDVLPCHGQGGFQYWWMNVNRFLLRDYTCLGISPSDRKSLIVAHCATAGTWSYQAETKRLRHSSDNQRCLSVVMNVEGPHQIARAQLVPCDQSELDSELLDDKSTVMGVLTADEKGLCLMAHGDIDKNLAWLTATLASAAAQLEPNSEEVPTIVLDSNNSRLLIKQDDEVAVAILKKT